MCCLLFLASLYARIRQDFKLFREACPPALVRTPASHVRSYLSDWENVVIQYEGSQTNPDRMEKSEVTISRRRSFCCLSFMTANILPPWSAKKGIYPFSRSTHQKSLVIFTLALITCCRIAFCCTHGPFVLEFHDR